MQNAVSRVLNLTGSGHGVSREQPPFGSILDQLVEFRRISALLAEARRTLLPKGRLSRWARTLVRVLRCCSGYSKNLAASRSRCSDSRGAVGCFIALLLSSRTFANAPTRRPAPRQTAQAGSWTPSWFGLRLAHQDTTTLLVPPAT